VIKWIKNWYYTYLEKKYNNKTVEIPQADFKYPPPSAYEVKQISRELGIERKKARQYWETPASYINKQINKE